MLSTGIVLAAGAGTRAGGPKALRRDADGVPWLHHALGALAACEHIVVVLGARAEAAEPLLRHHGAEIVVAADWAEGMSASLRAGLAAASGDVAIVSLVDLPGMPSTAVERMLEVAASAPDPRAALAQATYAGRPGHPVLLGADHWDTVRAAVFGDRGARSYLVAHGAPGIPCDDLWNGADVDGPLLPPQVE